MPLMSDWVCARATAARAVASPVCAEVASGLVKTEISLDG
jgi:hypothetical protein